MELPMADGPVVHIGENSPEQVAYTLMQDVMRAEMKSLAGGTGGWQKADRQYILDTYSECLQAMMARRPSGK